ncbi:MAG: hypothetical protein ACUVSX_12750, partial [Aggregatilineales bacterium]
ALNSALRRLAEQLNIVKNFWKLHVLPLYHVTLAEEQIRAWALTEALLDEMQAVAAAAGAQLLIVYLPEDVQIIDARWEATVNSTEVQTNRCCAMRPTPF